jgi:hypothetical protein
MFVLLCFGEKAIHGDSRFLVFLPSALPENQRLTPKIVNCGTTASTVKPNFFTLRKRHP